jgi:nucleoside-diphosphate-sugar epimerase
MNKKILITGGSGFLGANLAKHLKKVTKNFIIKTADRIGSSDFIGDLSNESFVNSLEDFDIVIHCAAVQYVTRSKPLFFRKKWFYLNNVKATENLIKRYEGTNTFFIYIGTSMQYYQNNSKNYSVKSVMHSQGVYSWSKLAAQKIVDTADLKSATIIPCIIGGPGREGLFKNFVNSIHKWELALIPGKGNFQISIVHVDDVVSLIALVVKKQVPGYFNAAAIDAYSIINWIQIIKSALKTKSIKCLHIPLLPLILVSKILSYRLLAKEQLKMLAMPHVLEIESSLKIGWQPKNKTKDIISDIALYLTKA